MLGITILRLCGEDVYEIMFNLILPTIYRFRVWHPPLLIEDLLVFQGNYRTHKKENKYIDKDKNNNRAVGGRRIVTKYV